MQKAKPMTDVATELGTRSMWIYQCKNNC